jgi:CheY-like chemotaxis protein
VEDNPSDIRLMQEAFREAGGGDFPNLNVARNGPQALAFLRREAPYQASPRPAFILLDLNLPGADGSELLAEIKKDRLLRQIPVIVFSTSTRTEDIARAYDLHANCFISKPRDLESLVEAIRSIQVFWLGMAASPDATPRFRLAADQAKPLVSRESA